MSTAPGEISKSRLGRLLNGQTAFDFYGHRRIGLIGAVIVVVVTIISLFVQGLNLGLDFEGGNAWEIPASQTFGVAQAQKVLQDNGISTVGARVQRRASQTTDVITVQIKEVPTDQAKVLTAAFAKAAGVEVKDISVSFTSSTWGKEITDKAIRALVIFLLAVSLFITLRFEWRMALAALGAMAHDVIAVVGAYSLFQFEVTPATVVAFLTILGYSLYDTIVVFDRVKENEGKLAGARTRYEDVVNISMNQVLMRSLNTSMASVLPVISLLLIGWGLLGAVALQEFALALLIGMISGVYSSIFIATPLLAIMRADKSDKPGRPRLTGEALRAAVIGTGAAGRLSASMASELGGTAAVATSDAGDDGVLVGAEAATAPLESASTSERLLSHPPRPRKKKRH
jgi:preprotein translocase subunit SecF